MNRLAAILPVAQVLVQLDASSKKRAFEEAGLLFENQQGLNRSLITDSLFARERLGSTGLGQGIAIPHGRIRGLDHSIGYFARPKKPIIFEAPDGQPVRDIFVLLVPEAATDEHLQILSELAQRFSNRAFRDELAAATDPAVIHALFSAPYA